MTNSKTLISVGMILIAAVVVGFMIAKPILRTGQSSMPVFMGEEMTVHRTANIAAASVSAKPVTKADVAVKSAVVPMPQPQAATTALPIIPPAISFSVLPAYPAAALEQGVEGMTVLSIYVGLNGNAEKVEVKTSSGVPEFDRSATNAAAQWKFTPASQGGGAIASWFEVPVRFSIN